MNPKYKIRRGANLGRFASQRLEELMNLSCPYEHIMKSLVTLCSILLLVPMITQLNADDESSSETMVERENDILFLDQKSNITRFSYDKPACEPGTAPIGNYVLFDCKWVEIPDHWKFVDGKWKEDPSVLKLGPEPSPNCPDVDVCTCSGKFNYYNFTDKRCHSSPYMPEFYQKACTQYSKMEFAGWTFNENLCEWISISSPYDDERLRLASEKVGVGGLGMTLNLVWVQY